MIIAGGFSGNVPFMWGDDVWLHFLQSIRAGCFLKKKKVDRCNEQETKKKIKKVCLFIGWNATENINLNHAKKKTEINSVKQ